MLLCLPSLGLAQQLGDLDNDQVATVRDLALLLGEVNGSRPLSENLKPLADLDQDGDISQADADELLREILGAREPETLPLAGVRLTSPNPGEEDVAVTREVIIHFSMPLALNALIDTTNLFATFGDQPLLSRVELSGDRKKATLFFLEPLPSNARIQVSLLGAGLTDLLGRPLDLDRDGTPGGDTHFVYDTLSITPLSGTAIMGRVFSSQPGVGQQGNPVDVPLAGVTITVDGAEETLRTVTDANGNFLLSPCPAGAFFVKIDGRTSPASNYPNGRYYPVVGKQWYALPGRLDNLATETGNIYLPEICPGTLQPVGLAQETTIQFPQDVLNLYPELAGTELVVPANSLFSDDGNRGGRVGIAPVPPQRLPEPLPPGLDLPLVITIQTDGPSNFDQPVPVCFPNLPDPTTGEPLPPGAESALWSFNHDLGDWEVVGSMTVTADGLFVKTDPGVGVRQPGWHGTRPGTQATGEGPGMFPEDEEDPEEPEEEPTEEEVVCPNSFDGPKTVRLLYELAKEGVSCAASLGKLSEAVDCIRSVVFGMTDLIDKIWTFSDEMQKGGVSWQSAQAFIATVKSAKGLLLTDCIEVVPDPLAEARNIFNCVGNAINVFDTVCGVLDPDPPPPGGIPDECQPGWLLSTACGGNRVLKDLHGRISPILNYLGTVSHSAVQAAACAALDGLELLVKDLTPPANRPDVGNGKFAAKGEPDRMLTAQEIADIQAGITNVIFESQQFVNAVREYPELNLENQEYQRVMDRQLQDLSRVVNQHTESASGITYWAIDIDVLTLRGKVVPKGRINAILSPNLPYTIKVFNPATGLYDEAPGFSAPNGRASYLSATILDPSSEALPDADGDGVPDAAEHVLGTRPDLADTDGDGMTDLAEALEGTDPNEGLLVDTGMIANIPSRGRAQEICALDDLAVTANGNGGITLYNVFSGLNPTRVAELATPGPALDVACFGSRLAVAEYSSGLQIIDIRSPSQPRSVRLVNLNDAVTSVAAYGPTVFAGTQKGMLYAVDIFTGAILDQLFLGAGQVHDLDVSGERLFALQGLKLSTLDLTVQPLQVAFTQNTTGPLHAYPRLFAGTRTLHTSWLSGANIFDIQSTTNAPVAVARLSTTQRGWKRLVANGSGLGLAAVGINSTYDGPHHLDVYNLGPEGTNTTFILTYPTPGFAESVAVYNGLAYVADNHAGLSVVNYRSYDQQGIAPTIQLSANIDLQSPTIEEGKLLRFSADVVDDVQVRQVKFYVDGELAQTDGSFPFEYRFLAPALASQSVIRVQARAEDTGGNSVLSPEFFIPITPDSTPPQWVKMYPGNGDLVFPPSELFVVFNEPILESSLATNGLSLINLGLNGVPGGGDDVAITNRVLRFREESLTAFMSFSTPLSPGVYQLEAGAGIQDLAGNALANPGAVIFSVASTTDTDSDGVADDWELVLGLDPNLPDTDTDLIPDGQEDFDQDGVSNADELRLGLDPRKMDSDGDGTPDGQEDLDFDGLTNAQESALGTDALLVDTDGDGFDDATENSTGTDPLDDQSGPVNLVSLQVTYVNAVDSSLPGTLAQGTTTASRPASYINFVPDAKPLTVPTSTALSVTSYLNFTPATKPATLPTTTASGVVSYENQP